MTDSALAGRGILLVEDEMAVAMLLEDMLEELGCRVAATAARPAQALEAIEAHAFDAAILDVSLDGEDSYGIAAALAARGIPFVFSTGYGALGLRLDFRDRPLLQKPFRRRDLARALARALEVDAPE